jgi:hypothetical protein
MFRVFAFGPYFIGYIQPSLADSLELSLVVCCFVNIYFLQMLRISGSIFLTCYRTLVT